MDVPSVGGRLMLVDMAGSENIEAAGQTGFEAKMQVFISLDFSKPEKSYFITNRLSSFYIFSFWNTVIMPTFMLFL